MFVDDVRGCRESKENRKQGNNFKEPKAPKAKRTSFKRSSIKQFNCLIKLNQENLIKRNQIRVELKFLLLREKLFRVKEPLPSSSCWMAVHDEQCPMNKPEEEGTASSPRSPPRRRLRNREFSKNRSADHAAWLSILSFDLKRLKWLISAAVISLFWWSYRVV